MNDKIIILTSNTNFFGQALSPWESINLDEIKRMLGEKYSLEILTYDEIQFLDISNSFIIYTSSQESNLKNYYEDILIYLMQKGNTLIPHFNIFKCHDNKGFQELYKNLISIKSIDATYSASDKLKSLDTKYPVVFKSPDGAAGSSVTLVKNKKSLGKQIKKLKNSLYNLNSIKNISKQYIKKYIFRKTVSKENFEYFRPKARFVLQKFIPNIDHDFKVLIFWDKFYVLKRHVRKNDFRASGSGNFQFEEADSLLLDFCEQIFKKMKVPFLSLDICHHQGKYYLIEFQGVHFGPYTLLFSDAYYKKEEDKWLQIKEKSILEEEFSRSIDKFITHLSSLEPNPQFFSY